MRRLTLVAVLAAIVSWLAAIGTTPALAATPFSDIASPGPLEHVYLGNELSCQVAHSGDAFLEFYPSATIPGDCGTFVVVGSDLYAPDFLSHGGTATGGLGSYTPFAPVSQSGLTGSGTAADPYTVVTTVDVGATGLQIQQTDSYVVGDEAYRTSIALSNTSVGTLSGVLYRGGDCFLGGSDFGFGLTETFGLRKAVGCSENADNSPPGRIEEWVPLTGGNTYYQDFYSSVWSWIGGHSPFPDTCGCTTFQDNGGGISWVFEVPAGGSLTFAHVTTFSPTGKEPLVTAKTADSPTATAGSQDGYTITISNPNPDAVTLNSLTDTLPAGFAYVPGSSSGVTTSDPSVSTQTLTWSGPFTVPANGSVSLHFIVAVATTPGDYLNDAGGDAADGYTVLPTGPTAQVTVTAPPPPPPPPTGEEGCSHGYWKNHAAAWQGYSPSQSVASVFSGAGAVGSSTLAQALAFKGGPGLEGAERILLRQAVAALLNAVHPDVAYPKTAAEVLAEVDAALTSGSRSTLLELATTLDELNNLGCPL